MPATIFDHPVARRPRAGRPGAPPRLLPRCEGPDCPKRLNQHQGHYCSHACRQARTGLPTQTCPGCARRFRPHDRDQICCSVACSALVRPSAVLDQLLALLIPISEWYWSLSDLAIWIYGSDDQDDLHATRMLLARLRRLGYQFETRRVNWDTNRPRLVAYRLASPDPAGVATRAAPVLLRPAAADPVLQPEALAGYR